MAFFAVMGGFCCEDSTANGTLWSRLDVETLCCRRTMDIICDYSLSEVQDKSKAGAIAKAVACFQAGWLLLQCFGRQLEGIHITLLELNTAIHVVLAIFMYIIWWEKPLDIGHSIPVDCSRLGTDNSAIMIYADKVRYGLESAEKKVPVELTNSDDKQPETSGGEAHNKIRVAVTIFRNFREAPEDAGRIFKLAPHTIRRFFQHVIREETKCAVLENYKKQVEIPVATTVAAYKAAFAAANETAFRIARKQVDSDEYKQAAKGIADYRILEKTVCTRLTTEKIVCTGCGITTEKIVCTSCGLTTEKIACTNCGLTTEKIACTSCGQTAGANHVSKNIIDHYGRKNFEKALEKVYIATRKNTFKDAFNAAFAATAASHLENTTSNSSPDSTLPSPPNRSELQIKILISAFRAANAAARAPSRHAVRLVAYDWALGKEGALNAATAALRNVTLENVGQDIKNGLELVTEEELNKALEKHFCSGAPRSGTDFGPTFAIVKQSTASVISTVAFRAIQEAKQATDPKDQKASKICDSVEKVLSTITPTEPKTEWKRLRSCFIKAFETVTDEVIPVPELFEPPTGENKKEQVNNVSQPSEVARENKSEVRAVKPEQQEKKSEIRVIESQKQKKRSEIKVIKAEEQEKGSEISTASNAEDDKGFGSKWRKLHRTTLLMFSGIAGAFYGGAHSTKWNSRWFPTEAERLLWRISCIVGSTAVIPIAIQLFSPFVLKHTRRTWHDWRTRRAQPVQSAESAESAQPAQPTLPAQGHADTAHPSAWSRTPLPVQIVCSVCWVFFIAARVYIVVESFLSVRSLPRDAFRAVSWTNAIPHI